MVAEFLVGICSYRGRRQLESMANRLSPALCREADRHNLQTHQITLNGNAQLGHLITRTDPIAIPTVDSPPAATGTRDVTLNSSTQSAGDFVTLRDLTLDGNVGMVAVPPGTYRRFTANGNTGFIFGVAGSSQPAVYNLNSLTLNGASQLQIAGPVVLTTATALTLHSTMGSASNPLWLNLKVAAGDVNLNGGSTLYGAVTTPSGTITINGNSQLIGNVKCDRLTLNANGLLRIITSNTTPPVLTVQQPAQGAITNAEQLTVSGTFSDDEQTAITVNGVNAAITGNNFSASVPLVEGQNTLLIVATDASNNSTEVSRIVTRDTTVPTIAISEPGDGAFTKNTEATVTGTYNDATATTITVNGTAATLSGSAFSAVVAVAEGPNTLTIKATDAAGNNSEVTRSIIRDTVLPEVLVEQPYEGSFTNSDNVTVTGTIADTNTVSVTVNGVTSAIANGRFTITVPLNPGANVLNVLAIDAANNQIGVPLTVQRVTDTSPPSITLTEPANGAVFAGNALTVSGTAADDLPITLTVNDVTLHVATNGQFAGIVHVPSGSNQLTFVARDAVGNQSQVVRSVVVDTESPVISNLTPADGTTIQSQTATIGGQVSDATTVSVKVNGVNAVMNAGNFSKLVA